jgi:hypothetical protein
MVSQCNLGAIHCSVCGGSRLQREGLRLRYVFMRALGWVFVSVLMMSVTSGCHHNAGTRLTGKAHIRWKVIDSVRGTVLSEGEKDLQPSDFTSRTLSRAEPGDMIQQTLSLGNHFAISLGRMAEGADSLGFGLTADKDDEKLFSWEWFTVDGDAHATKLQESGELALEKDAGRIVRTAFLTDVSLRATPMAMLSDPPTFKYRVEIAKGSIIDWPK